ncbi:HNH endonuclease signature motif containing protein [Nocardioides aquiterrae]|uniref:HNH domain-containing protein n=1 Tax=Nocardioides aquiterrae TaxID=203799 RepID=A0ABP4F2L0_9ACTN
MTTAIWLALIARDQHCTFPGCKRLPNAGDAHHVIHWADGGPTSLDNLASA